MHDILQLRVNPDEFEQLRECQITPPSDCHATFTVSSKGAIWPGTSWGESFAEDSINIRGWFPLLDKMGDELLIWRPQGGCFFVNRAEVRYRRDERHVSGVLFMEIEVNRLKRTPPLQPDVPRTNFVPRFISHWG